MNRSGVIRQQLFFWGIVLGLWALLVLAFSGQLVFSAGLEWVEALRLSLRNWLPWALLTPATIWVATRFPLERNRLAVSVPVHALACIVAVLCCDLILRPLPPPGPNFRPPGGGEDGRPFRPGFPPEEPPPLRGRFPPEQRRHNPYVSGLVMRAQFNIPIYWVIVSIVHALSFYRRSEERERQAAELEMLLAEARLQALRMQLHPHFLFNTLNAIATLVHKDATAADEMIGNLSELLRATLDTSEHEIPLHRELDFLNRYLEIQQVRFGDRLRVEKAVDAAALEAMVPPLILQPLVENAVRHGIEPHRAAGLVHIDARRDGGLLRLTVRDSGTGPKPRTQPPQGIGLANTRARLRELYGDGARLTLTSGAEGGFSVELQIPYHEHTGPKEQAQRGPDGD